MKIGIIFLSGVIQIVLWVGMLVLVGVIIALINSAFYKIVGTKAHAVCIATGAIGTPIHEIGHAVFCLLFGHKIVDIKLFQPNSSDGSLGYVSHTYNPKNIYQRIGNFFIGVGPIIFGSAVMLLLTYLLANNVFDALTGVMSFYSAINPQSFLDYVKISVGGLNVFMTEMFSLASFKNPLWYVFIILGCMISLHMRLSREDIKGSLTGLLLTVAAIGIVPIIIGLINMNAMYTLTNALTTGAVYCICVYLISILLSLMSLVFGVLIKLINLLIIKVKRK